MYGIYVHIDGHMNYARALVHSNKTIETRSRDVFKSIPPREKVAVIETGKGEPMIVGYIKMDRGFHCPAEQFHLYDLWHLVKPGSRYDTTERGKWLYPVHWAQALDEPVPLPANHINHGRSYTEFTL
jgi:hypothetical protein